MRISIRLRVLLWGGMLSGLVFWADTAAARAGGGGGYSGGGGFSGGGFSGRGFSGSGFSGAGSIDLQNITMADWGLFFFTVVGLLLVAWLNGRLQQRFPSFRGDLLSGGSGTTDGLDSTPTVLLREHQTHLASLSRIDPAFDWPSFAARFEVAFLKIQGAWQYHQLDRVQHFVSDGILERFALQLQEQRENGYRDHMDGISVRETKLAEFQAGDVFESITIQVTATAIDYRVSFETGEFLSGNRSPDQFTEYWSFVRRRGVSSRAAAGLIEGACPNCSAPISLTQTGQCSSCNAVVRSGEYDWVLSEITQACEWAPHHADRDGLLRSLRAHDPGLSCQHLEDRASVVFWRHAMAERTGNIRAIQKVATETFAKSFQTNRLTSNTEGWRQRVTDCSVGAVELIGIVREDSLDYAVVRVKWAGKAGEFNSVKSKERVGSWTRRKSLLILVRQSEATTNLQSALKSSHCPNCAAPESDVAAASCEYCGEVLNTGKHDWVIAEYHLHAEPEAQRWIERLKQNSVSSSSASNESEAQYEEGLSAIDMLANMVVVLAADGQILPDEHEALLQFAQKNDIPETMLQGLKDAAKKGELDAQAPEELAAGRRWLHSLTKLALVDGIVDSGETKALTKLGAKYGLVRADIELIIAKRIAVIRRQATA
ncbi:TIM44-like domain-containing protein [Verrucomicrobia bacterium]|nr:TIM44-like domain-containing protein [Verrucomicrobiota bacterium]